MQTNRENFSGPLHLVSFVAESEEGNDYSLNVVHPGPTGSWEGEGWGDLQYRPELAGLVTTWTNYFDLVEGEDDYRDSAVAGSWRVHDLGPFALLNRPGPIAWQGPAIAPSAADATVGEWGDWTCRDVGPHLTCHEAWWMHDLLQATGHADVADWLIAGHAAGDDHDGDCEGARP